MPVKLFRKKKKLLRIELGGIHLKLEFYFIIQMFYHCFGLWSQCYCGVACSSLFVQNGMNVADFSSHVFISTFEDRNSGTERVKYEAHRMLN